MPASRTRVLEFPVDVNTALEASRHAVAAVIEGTPRVNGRTVTGSVRTSWASWGENLTLTVSDVANGSRITVRSASKMPTQFLDWGKHRKNLNRLQHELETAAHAHAAVIDPG
ncbi:MAG TPA: hypothetical protein H9830_11805 [Candidatus Agrococcus pullicola]|uniref:DUF1499 domain-containing protein n=1 Tax=Candidatus Agrococcus pullicola TaxID=2838429 RepID=A0A9D2CA51_9MICO|nr:hypothetical protein [Candidatus Agrococcus pullicola]